MEFFFVKISVRFKLKLWNHSYFDSSSATSRSAYVKYILTFYASFIHCGRNEYLIDRKIFTNRDLWADVAYEVLHPPVQIILQYGRLVAGGGGRLLDMSAQRSRFFKRTTAQKISRLEFVQHV